MEEYVDVADVDNQQNSEMNMGNLPVETQVQIMRDLDYPDLLNSFKIGTENTKIAVQIIISDRLKIMPIYRVDAIIKDWMIPSYLNGDPAWRAFVYALSPYNALQYEAAIIQQPAGRSFHVMFDGKLTSSIAKRLEGKSYFGSYDEIVRNVTALKALSIADFPVFGTTRFWVMAVEMRVKMTFSVNFSPIERLIVPLVGTYNKMVAYHNRLSENLQHRNYETRVLLYKTVMSVAHHPVIGLDHSAGELGDPMEPSVIASENIRQRSNPTCLLIRRNTRITRIYNVDAHGYDKLQSFARYWAYGGVFHGMLVS